MLNSHGRRGFRCLSLDPEVGVRDTRIRALADVRSDTGESLTGPHGTSLARNLIELDRVAEDIDFLLGHNLIAFALPLLQAASPGLRMLRLAAVDTRRLNLLAFPRLAFHHLVMHFQDAGLKLGRVNHPELDARLGLAVFDDQTAARPNPPSNLLTAWRCPTTSDWAESFRSVLVITSGPTSTHTFDVAAPDPFAAVIAGVHHEPQQQPETWRGSGTG